jgi:hypothetical protein
MIDFQEIGEVPLIETLKKELCKQMLVHTDVRAAEDVFRLYTK